MARKELVQNKIVEYDTYAELIISKGKEELARILIDLEDIERCRKIKWYYNKNRNSVRTVINEKTIYLNRFIMNVDTDIYVAFKSRDTMDCRKENLIICSRSEQMINNGVRRNNRSGVNGVNWAKRESKWRAIITINGERINLGYYDMFKDAVNARKVAEEQYFSQYRYR